MKLEDLDLYSLKYFLDAVENKSLTQSAEINFVTRSAISQSIQRLENWAGKQLLTHEKKTFRLTPQGEIFYRQLKTAYVDFQKSLEATPDHARTLKIGCSSSLTESLLFPALRGLGSIGSLQLSTGTSSQLIHKLNEKEINIALFIGDKNVSEKNQKIIKSGSFVLASKSGELSDKVITTEMRPEVLAMQRIFLKQKKAPNTYLTVESWSLGAKLAQELNCACLIPDLLVNKGLKKIPLVGFKHEYHIILRHKSPEMLTESEAQLIKLLTK